MNRIASVDMGAVSRPFVRTLLAVLETQVATVICPDPAAVTKHTRAAAWRGGDPTELPAEAGRAHGG
jgi:hypothetical protein